MPEVALIRGGPPPLPASLVAAVTTPIVPPVVAAPLAQAPLAPPVMAQAPVARVPVAPSVAAASTRAAVATSIVAAPWTAPVQTPVFPIDVAIEPARPVLRTRLRDEEMPDCLDGSARTRRIKRLFLSVMILGLAVVFALVIASQFRPR